MNSLWQLFGEKFLFRFDPDHEQLRQALRTVFNAACAMLLLYFFQWPEGAWLILCTLFLTQTRSGNDLLSQIKGILFIGLLCSLGVFISLQFNTHSVLLAVYLASVSGLAVFLIGLKNTLLPTCFFTTLLIIISAGLPQGDDTLLQRPLLTLLAAFIVACSYIIFLPQKNIDLLRKNLYAYFYLSLCFYLSRLKTQDITDPKNQFAEHFFRRITLMRLQNIRQLAKKSLNFAPSFIEHCEIHYEMNAECLDLIYQIKSHPLGQQSLIELHYLINVLMHLKDSLSLSLFLRHPSQLKIFFNEVDQQLCQYEWQDKKIAYLVQKLISTWRFYLKMSTVLFDQDKTC